MEPHKVERRLAAILHADVKGYSRLIGEDEVATLRVLAAYLEMMSTLVQRHGGRAVGSRGDSLLAEFPSVVEAVQGAVEMQHELKVRNAELPVTRRVEFRMGINLGEIVVEGDQIHGDGINIAVRLEGLAEAGGIYISEIVHEQVKNRLPLQYMYVGERTLKNIEKLVRVWQVVMEPEEVRSPESKGERQKPRRVGTAHRTWVVVGGVALIMAVIVAVRYLARPPLSPQSSALITQEAPALPLPDKPSIVVLPFVNMSKDPDQEYFSDGLTEVLTGDLSKLSGLFVIARNSAFTYKGKAVKVQDVGREMGVRYVLEGSVLKADGQVRIAAQLIDATTGYHLWSERYDRPLKDILTLQDEIVQKIVTTLKLQLTLSEQGVPARKTTDNLEAYDSFLRGLEYEYRFTKEANIQARQMWEKAIKLDPQYAAAYAALGTTYYIEWLWRWSQDSQTLEQAFALAQRAIALDDTWPWAHGLLGFVYAQKRQYDQAIAEGERAIALDPNNADSYVQQAEVLSFSGKPEEALRLVEKAMRLNPRYPAWYLFEVGWAYGLAGRYAEAITALKTVLLRNPDFLTAYLWLADCYLWQWAFQLSLDPQTLERGLGAAQRTVALNDSYWFAHLVLGYVDLYQQQYDQALVEMERAVALDPNEAWSYAGLGEVLSRVGRSEKALGVAEKALRLKPIMVDAHLDSVGAAYALAGRPDEALASLKQFLSRYPNILGAHLTLVAVYSELGKEAEARAEAAEVLRINPKFSLEVHKQRAPIKDPAILERHLAALRKAGLK